NGVRQNPQARIAGAVLEGSRVERTLNPKLLLQGAMACMVAAFFDTSRHTSMEPMETASFRGRWAVLLDRRNEC
ncbi:MAG: hypothetical protein OXU70_14460, partial [Gammaproteobacteria bacterium]|nr:hypothetical protein [Gammaproteobacteria bacterium]